MKLEYHTQNLILKALAPTDENAMAVLEFYERNKDIFEVYEAARPENFYTKAYQKSVLSCEFSMAVKSEMFRFWVYKKENPTKIIGTISFFHFMRCVYQCCETGYKFDSNYWHKGYAKEALQYGISLMFEEENLHRIEAYVMPSNIPSIKLLESLGFIQEGLCRSSICVHGKWEDHLLFSLLR